MSITGGSSSVLSVTRWDPAPYWTEKISPLSRCSSAATQISSDTTRMSLQHIISFCNWIWGWKIKGLTWFWFCSPLLAAPGWEQPTVVGVPHLCHGPVWWRDAPGGGSQMDVPQNPLSDTLQSQKTTEGTLKTEKASSNQSEISQLRRRRSITWAL